MVLMPKALADVRSVKHQRKRPFFSVAGAVSATGQAVEVEFSPGGQVARDRRGAAVHDVVEVRYGLGDDLWPRFIAKVALGCASLLLPDDWLGRTSGTGSSEPVLARTDRQPSLARWGTGRLW
jgi:hypothetical protein